MTQKRRKTFALLASLAVVLSLAGCHKKAAKVTPPPPPAAAPVAPTATLAANPNVIQQGQSTVLTWQTSNANEIAIAGLGTQSPSGSRSITPSESTTYTLVAKGPGGTKDVSARVTVNAPIAKATPSPTDEELFSKNVKDVFFNYDKRSKMTQPSSRSMRALRFSSKDTVTTADPRNTTLPSEPVARNR
jgi:peptidoglycan-associated lipoprotein